MHGKRIMIAVLLIILCIVSVTLVWAQEDEACEQPTVAYLAERTGDSCQEILDLHATGVGYGQMMKAAIIAETLDNTSTGWRDLLEMHQAGVGWGQINRAYNMAENLDLTGEDLLALREADMGWGQIMHAQYLADADLGISFDEAVEMMQDGKGWGEIRDELGLEKGPPPWANQGGKNGNNSGSANNNGNGLGQGNGHGNGLGNGRGNSGKGTNGPPPWAGQDDADD